MIASSMFLTRSMICKQISSFHNPQSYCNHNAICVIKTESFLFYNYRDAVLISGIADDCKGLLGLQRIVQDCNVSRYYFGIKLIVAIVQYLWLFTIHNMPGYPDMIAHVVIQGQRIICAIHNPIAITMQSGISKVHPYVREQERWSYIHLWDNTDQ